MDRRGWGCVVLISINVTQIEFGGEGGLTGATAAFSAPTMDPCIAENMMFLYDITTPNSSR